MPAYCLLPSFTVDKQRIGRYDGGRRDAMHDFVTIPEAARMLGITEVSVRDAVKRDEIIGGKIGGRYIVSRQSVVAYRPREYKSRRAEAGPGPGAERSAEAAP